MDRVVSTSNNASVDGLHIILEYALEIAKHETFIIVCGKVCLLEVFVVPESPHLLVLASDFWRVLHIIHDLRTDEVKFSNEPILGNSLKIEIRCCS